MKLLRKSLSLRASISVTSGESVPMRTEPSYNVVGHEDDFPRHRPQRLGASSTDCDDNDKGDVRSQSKTIESKAMHQASWASCVINLSSTILGAGILGVPYAISLMGWIPGLVSLTISALLSAFGLHLMAECALQLPGVSSFYAVALFTVPELATLVDILVTVKGFGTVTAYVLVIADSLTLAFKSSPWTFLRSRFWVISLSYLIIGPLSYFPSLDSLKFSSALSVVMVFVLTLMIIVYAMHAKNSIFDPCPMTHTASPDEMVCSADSVVFAGKASSFLRAFPIFLFGFTCQQNAFTVVNELKDPTRRRLNSIFITSIASSWAVNMVVGICGYATFGAMTHSDILKNYPENALTSTCRVLMALVVICHYPLQLHPSRRTALSLWQRFVPPSSSVPTPASVASSMATSIGAPGGGSPRVGSTRENIDEEEAVANQSTFSPLTTATSLSPTRHLPSPLTPHSPTPLLSSTNDALASPPPSASPTAAAAAATVDAKTFQRRFFLYTTFFNVVVYCISISVDDLGVVLSLLGSTMSCIVILLLPGTFYGRLAARMMAPKDDFRLNTFVGFHLPSLSSIMHKFGLKPSVAATSSTASSLNMAHGGSRNHDRNNPLHAYQHAPNYDGTINDDPHDQHSGHGSFDDNEAQVVVELTSFASSSPHQRKVNRRVAAAASDDVHNTLPSPAPMHHNASNGLIGGVSLVPTSSSLSTWSEHGLITAADDADGVLSPIGAPRVSARVSDDVLPGVRWKRYAAWSIVGFGLIVLCVSLASILSSSSSSSGSH